MELDTNGILETKSILNQMMRTSSTGNGIVELSDGRKCVMSQILYDTSVLFNIYENGLLSLVNKYPIASLNAWLYNLTELDNSILLAGKISNYQYLSEGLLIKTNKHGNKIWEKALWNPNFDIGIGKLSLST